MPVVIFVYFLIVLVSISLRNFRSKIRSSLNVRDVELNTKANESKSDFSLHEAYYLGSKTLFVQELCNPHVNLEVKSEGKTMLQVALENPHPYSKFYIDMLLQSGAKVENVNNFLLLEHCSGRASNHLLQRVLHLGVDPNLQNSRGQTVLHLLLIGSIDHEHFYGRLRRNAAKPDICDKVVLLLFHGADPTIECYSKDLQVPKPLGRGYNAFEIAVLKKHPGWLQEHLFLLTYDDHAVIKIDFLVLIRLAKRNTLLFLRALEVAQPCANSFCDITLLMFYEDFFELDLDLLKILVERCLPQLCQIFGLYQYIRVDGLSLNLSYLKSNLILEKIDFLMGSSPVLRNHIIHGFFGYFSPYCFWSVIKVNKNPQIAFELISYFMQYGAKLYTSLFSVVFSTYGYCSLYKFLLNVEAQYDYFPKEIKSSFIYEFDLDLETFFDRNCSGYSCHNAANQLLENFAHWKLPEFLKKNRDEFKLSESDLNRVECHPKVPRLVEIGRNAFRKHLVKRFDVKSTREFYGILNALPIADAYKKIVMYESKLYYA